MQILDLFKKTKNTICLLGVMALGFLMSCGGEEVEPVDLNQVDIELTQINIGCTTADCDQVQYINFVASEYDPSAGNWGNNDLRSTRIDYTFLPNGNLIGGNQSNVVLSVQQATESFDNPNYLQAVLVLQDDNQRGIGIRRIESNAPLETFKTGGSYVVAKIVVNGSYVYGPEDLFHENTIAISALNSLPAINGDYYVAEAFGKYVPQ